MPRKCISDHEVEECTACGFVMDAGGCKYEMCPQSSPENCPPCGYLEAVEGSDKGRCAWEPAYARPLSGALT